MEQCLGIFLNQNELEIGGIDANIGDDNILVFDLTLISSEINSWEYGKMLWKMFAGELKQLFPSTFTNYEPDEVFLGLLLGCISGKFNYGLIIFTSSMRK